MKEEETYGLSPERLSRLLAIGVEGCAAQDKSGACDSPEELLQEMLDSALPLDSELPDSLSRVLNQPGEEIVDTADATLGDLLVNSGTDLVVIEMLRVYAKELVRRGGPEAKKAAATAIYYGAIASALLFHQQKITQHSYEQLHKAYTELEQKFWISSQLRELFQRARALCREREVGPEG